MSGLRKKPHVLIAGAGIGGLTAALALLRKGINVDVYEQAPELKEIGAGVHVGPNGTRVLQGACMACPASPLGLPLHSDFRVLAQCGRDILRQAHTTTAHARRLPLRR
jgi:2-polyprenyl-6-methoxyphenol hydroxylase-like FAD-dependent oxidoreductase